MHGVLGENVVGCCSRGYRPYPCRLEQQEGRCTRNAQACTSRQTEAQVHPNPINKYSNTPEPGRTCLGICRVPHWSRRRSNTKRKPNWLVTSLHTGEGAQRSLAHELPAVLQCSLSALARTPLVGHLAAHRRGCTLSCWQCVRQGATGCNQLVPSPQTSGARHPRQVQQQCCEDKDTPPEQRGMLQLPLHASQLQGAVALEAPYLCSFSG